MYRDYFCELRSSSTFYETYLQPPFCNFWVAEYSTLNEKMMIGTAGVRRLKHEEHKILETTNFLKGLQLAVGFSLKNVSCIEVYIP